ncbi:hypothetical protein NADE_000257 [Nannochloris sp. 'desiccata']|nr:hypothetical protein KSW81_004960 [Chlorella desiccata (nom. nud.)]KAH7618056.1 hypothetical protein NADE_000257 [Chlorella desiccata (nom. nud.)]
MVSGLIHFLTIGPTLALACHRRSKRAAGRVVSNIVPNKFSELHAHRVRLVTAFSTSDSISSSGGGNPSSSTSSPVEWRSHWRVLLEKLHETGHYKSDPHITSADVESDSAAMKRAVLNFTRQRADILKNLSATNLKNLVRAGLPEGEYSDRKSKNAYRRLEASFIKGQPLSPGDGGAADFQDVLRMILSLHAVATTKAAEDHGNNKEIQQHLGIAAGNILPEVLAAMELPPPEGAPVQSDKATNMQRLSKSKASRRPRDGSDQPWARSKW